MISKVLVIAGMHRSGTSLMAHYLSECGLFMGDKLLDVELNRSQVSYRGHHEDKEFLEFHKEVLKKKWISAFPTHSFRLPIRVGKQDREVALELVRSRAELPQWGWKDPRTTLFLEFWDEVIDNPRYLFLIRHPLSVVDSLLRRGNEKHINRHPINGLKTWRIYNQLVLDFWQKHQDSSIIYDIDELIHFPDQIRQVLIEKFGFELEKIPLDKVFSKSAFKTEHSAQVQDLKSRHSAEVAACMRLYQKLQTLASTNIAKV